MSELEKGKETNPDKKEMMPFDKGGLYSRLDASPRALSITIILLVIILVILMATIFIIYS